MRHFHVRPLQPCNNWCPQIHAFDHRYQSLSNSIASNNSTKDVHKDCCDFGIAGDEVERLLDGLWRRSPADVEEISRLSAIKLDDIHSGHRQASPIDCVTSEMGIISRRL